jgi:RNA polymerase sigma-70 factor (ECF subfamily)
LAFVESRLRRRDAAEDVVQETLIGFLTSLPNYDPARSLESYLFSIAAHKLTDYLRREGRRPAVPLSVSESSSGGDWNLPGKDRPASAIARSGEKRGLEAEALAAALQEQIDRWRSRGEWSKIECAELLIVRGWANKDVAAKLSISEQQVANQKFDLLARLKTLLKRQNLSADVFPELYEVDA